MLDESGRYIPGHLSRRQAVGLGLAALLAPGPAWAAEKGLQFGPSRPFSWEWLQNEALALAARPHVKPRRIEAAAAVDYDALNHIHYRAEAELWRGREEGAVRFFPLSVTAREPVNISVVERGSAREISWSPHLFDAPANSPLHKLRGDKGGFAGFRVMNPSGVGDWLAYLGASYFRSAGPLDQYGLSARAIAIDVALHTVEEFPLFTHFWLERLPDATLIHALLDGPRMAGAWRFVVRHTGEEVVQDVSAMVSLRDDVSRLGIAPLTSMYWYGETERGPRIDWRPEVHDSDGLLIHNGRGERLWRPLRNPSGLKINAFADHDPRGFGLMQRDRVYSHYEDDGVFYHKRPSLWVEPQSDWGAGAVELVEIPTVSEVEDNIVAFWRPATPAKQGDRLDFSYRLRWLKDEPDDTPLARVVATRSGLGGIPGARAREDVLKLVVDFEGPVLKGLGRDSGVDVDILTILGKVIAHSIYPVVEQEGRWRLMLDVVPDPGAVMDLRATLHRDGKPLGETWLYQVTP